MAELRTEEEQLEAIKRWWKENGTSLLAGAVLAAAGVFGWNAWQDYQQGQAVAASSSYQQLLDLASRDSLDDGALAQAQGLVDTLQEDHDGTLYSELALLLEARLEVDAGDVEGARESLETLIEGSDDGYLTGLARLRLARLQSAEGNHETALATLDGDIPEALAAQRDNVRGDIYHATGQRDQALEAWQSAQSLAEESGQPLYGISLKLDDLGDQEATL